MPYLGHKFYLGMRSNTTITSLYSSTYNENTIAYMYISIMHYCIQNSIMQNTANMVMIEMCDWYMYMYYMHMSHVYTYTFEQG